MDQDFDAFIAGFMGIFAFTSVICLAFYLIAAFARYRYLRIRSYDKAWMAFIPIANIWAVVEATYGKQEKINIYGWDAPAIVLKLWPMVIYVLAIVINVIPVLGNALSVLLRVLNIAVFVMIFRDMMENLENPQDTVISIIAVIIHLVGDIMILSITGRFNPGEQDWQTDNRVLGSQTMMNGPLSFLNGNKY